LDLPAASRRKTPIDAAVASIAPRRIIRAGAAACRPDRSGHRTVKRFEFPRPGPLFLVLFRPFGPGAFDATKLTEQSITRNRGQWNNRRLAATGGLRDKKKIEARATRRENFVVTGADDSGWMVPPCGRTSCAVAKPAAARTYLPNLLSLNYLLVFFLFHKRTASTSDNADGGTGRRVVVEHDGNVKGLD